MEKMILGGALRDTAKFSYRDTSSINWNTDLSQKENKGKLVSCEIMSGLYFAKSILSQQECEYIDRYINSVCVFNPPHESANIPPANFKHHKNCPSDKKKWTWFEFDPGRYMSACHPASLSSVASAISHDKLKLHIESLSDFEVYGNIPPSEWLDINQHVLDTNPLVSNGARTLMGLQQTIISELYDILPFPPNSLKCAFIQFQLMDPGVSIMPHIDSDDPVIDIIATLCVRGGKNMIRVGNVEFSLSPGNLYLLSDFARHHVKHEVFSSMESRLTVTFRFVCLDPAYRQQQRMLK